MNKEEINEIEYKDWLNKYQPVILEIDLIEMEQIKNGDDVNEPH